MKTIVVGPIQHDDLRKLGRDLPRELSAAQWEVRPLPESPTWFLAIATEGIVGSVGVDTHRRIIETAHCGGKIARRLLDTAITYLDLLERSPIEATVQSDNAGVVHVLMRRGFFVEGFNKKDKEFAMRRPF